MRLGLVALVLFTFSPSIVGEFVRWDDRLTIHQNPRLNPPTWSNVGYYWTNWQRGEYGLYMPVTHTAWSALSYVDRLGQADPAGVDLNPWLFHLASVTVHAAGAVVLFSLLFELLRQRWAAFAGAALWAVHPVQVESVAWASGLKDVLCGTLSLMTIWLYVRAAGGDSRSPAGRRAAYLFCVIVYAMALLSKPSAVVVGPICFVIDVLLLRRPTKVAVLGVLPLLALAAPTALIARKVQFVEHVVPTPFWARPLIAGDALAFYFGKMLFPFHLAIDYGRSPTFVLSQALTRVIWIVPAGLALTIFLTRKRALWTAGLIFVLALTPVLGFFRFQFQLISVAADHYLYLALLGPALAASWALTRSTGRTIRFACVILISLLAIRSFAQAGIWRDDFSLFHHALMVNPRSFAAHNNLGVAYAEQASLEQRSAELARDQGDFQTAYAHLQNRRRALELAQAHFQSCLGLRADYRDAKANLDQVNNLLYRSEDPAATQSSHPMEPSPK